MNDIAPPTNDTSEKKDHIFDLVDNAFMDPSQTFRVSPCEDTTPRWVRLYSLAFRVSSCSYLNRTRADSRRQCQAYNRLSVFTVCT